MAIEQTTIGEWKKPGQDWQACQLLWQLYSPRDRLIRALNMFLLFFGAAILTAFIPVVHFIAVPVCLVLSIFFAYRTYQTKTRLHAIIGSCPACQQNVRRELKLRPPIVDFWVICPQCQTQLKAQIAAENGN